MDCQVRPRTEMSRCGGIAPRSPGTGHQLLQGLLTAVAVDQQHLLDAFLLEAHVAELFPEVQELPCLALRELEHLHGLLHQALLVALPQQPVTGTKVTEKLGQKRAKGGGQ